MVVLVSAASAQTPATRDAPLDRLAKVEYFALGLVGYEEVTSPGEKDYRLILSRSSASADFERLFSIGNPQAKSYALVGLRALNLTRFKKLSSSVRDSKVDVLTLSGCVGSHESLGAVLKHIEAGHYGLPTRTGIPTWQLGQ